MPRGSQAANTRLWPVRADKTRIHEPSAVLVGVLMATSVSALVASNQGGPGWGVLGAASLGWGLSLWSMALISGLPSFLRMVWALGLQFAACHWLGQASHNTAYLSLGAFDAVWLVTVLRTLTRRLPASECMAVAAAVSPAVGASLSPHGFGLQEVAVMVSIALAWSVAHASAVHFLVHTEHSQGIQTSYPDAEEKLKTRALLWAELAALLALVPFYTDGLAPSYLAWTFGLGILYLAATGLSLTALSLGGRRALRWQRAVSLVYMGAVFVCLACYHLH